MAQQKMVKVGMRPVVYLYVSEDLECQCFHTKLVRIAVFALWFGELFVVQKNKNSKAQGDMRAVQKFLESRINR